MLIWYGRRPSASQNRPCILHDVCETLNDVFYTKLLYTCFLQVRAPSYTCICSFPDITHCSLASSMSSMIGPFLYSPLFLPIDTHASFTGSASFCGPARLTSPRFLPFDSYGPRFFFLYNTIGSTKGSSCYSPTWMDFHLELVLSQSFNSRGVSWISVGATFRRCGGRRGYL